MGKVHSHQGANQADRWRKGLRKRRRSPWRVLIYLLPLVMVPLAVGVTLFPSILDKLAAMAPAGLIGTIGASCNIKGNISINTGERIYHVPGQEHYWETKISPQYGERWFCSEAEAVAAGWRKAKR